MTLSLLNGPFMEPVSLTEAKLHIRLDSDNEDDLLKALITTARLHVERLTKRIFLQQTWRFYADTLPEDGLLEIPLGPLVSIDKVTFYNGEGMPKLIEPQDYVSDISSHPARIKFRPTVIKAPKKALNGIEIDFQVGFGITTLDVPRDLRQAVLMLVAHWYENRSEVSADFNLSPTPKGVDALIAPYRCVRL